MEILDSEEDCSKNTVVAQHSRDKDIVPGKSKNESHLISQVKLNDLVHETRTELLGSYLKQWNLLHDETDIICQEQK